ncbi:MAG TPA: zinc-dependent metalloprotease [Actinomycetota bacterium]
MGAPREVIDWGVAARVAGVVAGPGPETTPAQRASFRSDMAEFSLRSDRLVRAFTGLNPDGPPPEPLVLSRRAWITANVEGFRSMLAPLAGKLSGSVARLGLARRVTGAALGVQVGALLGYMAQKVLGQYDLVLASEGAGKVYYVGPNIVQAERGFGLAARDFRLWIAIHEITHRTQFAAVPWLRGKMRGLVERSLETMELDSTRLKGLVERGRALLAAGPAAWRTANVMELLMTDAQRALVGEMQALMSVVEGHGTFVMNRIGREEIPSFEALRHAIESRRGSARGAERAFQRLVGMEMKYAQYTKGERFIEQVAARAGVDAINVVWDREENLPTMEDLSNPDAWLARVRP